ncbi:hypothetical protein OCC_11292 [Thermococcus litoralis DSM 5473]|jgi:predicted secreted protein|uniref:DUF523 domain-containing protein n=1 Tax=Thermococcus litoralis (strain ATCC 51850 / DSM 5473 / JCM 8560 / NS-C) TaxID=523849 RepID=H3ZN99_THELN|nr:DUF523 domain-containing protein [Thermococcus litoralis]EHR78523.1 hypothetical protein OCC_11292 [Thermococcus litoralis DSM 5473]
MKLLIMAPCLLSPFYVYRGAKEKEYKTSEKLLSFLAEHKGEMKILTYPCPEYELIGWPRPPMSKEVFEKLGMGEKAENIADFIGRVLTEEKPEKIIFLGVKGSPTCGVFHTTSSNPETFPYKAIQEFFYLPKEERINRSKELIKEQSFEVVPGEGVLFEVLKRRFPDAVYLEFDKDSIEKSIEKLKEAVEGL